MSQCCLATVDEGHNVLWGDHSLREIGPEQMKLLTEMTDQSPTLTAAEQCANTERDGPSPGSSALKARL
ncbi:hypothetical protein EYF80_002240 [Liparis tanakae]|uniref:Uncharacterized protein n=1 Tax=Liparis tanakae TaxID=230148 RepID=A0A4Z2JCM0_9TELE|nr:hypothetical protein EYF80_002240 [Liparis tanakae]